MLCVWRAVREESVVCEESVFVFAGWAGFAGSFLQAEAARKTSMLHRIVLKLIGAGFGSIKLQKGLNMSSNLK